MHNRFDLTGKKALVTGGGRGLGRALALGLAQAGADVAVSTRNLKAGELVAEEIRQFGRESCALEADLTGWAGAAQLAGRAFHAMGTIDILVNNAGQTTGIKPALAVTAEYFTEVFGINVAAPLCLSSKIVEMVDGRHSLSIINISSMGVHRLISGGSIYAASKAALEIITRITALEWVDLGVRVNAIAPGPINTDMLASVEAVSPGTVDMVSRLIPMKRIADPDEFVGALLFLASAASSYVTGTVLSVNGGR